MERGHHVDALPLDVFEPHSGSQRMEDTSGLTPESRTVNLDDYPPVADAAVVRMVVGTDLGDLMGIIKLPKLADPEYHPYEGKRSQAMTQIYIFREHAESSRHRPSVIMMGHDQLSQIRQSVDSGGRVPLPTQGVAVLETNQYIMVGRGEQSWLPTHMAHVRDSHQPHYPRETYAMTSREHATVFMSESGIIQVSHHSDKGSTAVLHGEQAALPVPQDPFAEAEQAAMAAQGIQVQTNS